MRQPFIKNGLKVIIMLSVITKAFGLSTAPEHHPLMPRKINLSGNIVHFAMPENFSRDMPAEDMIESVDLSDKSTYQEHQKFTLIRRWWDFKNGGFFGKSFGTMMMSLYIKEASDSLNIDTLKPLDFIDIIIENIEKDKSNGDQLYVYSDYFSAYVEKWYSNQRWLMYAQGPLDGTQYSFLYAIPISHKQYLVAEFTSAPDTGILIRDYIDNHTAPFINKIMDSFHIEYQPNNPAGPAVMKSNGPSLEQLINEKMKLLEQTPPVN